jgi:hypothetical protein
VFADPAQPKALATIPADRSLGDEEPSTALVVILLVTFGGLAYWAVALSKAMQPRLRLATASFLLLLGWAFARMIF